MKKLFAFCLMALFAISISMNGQAIGPPSSYGLGGQDGYITFQIKQNAAPMTSVSKLCQVWASDNYSNPRQKLIGEYSREAGFGIGMYSIPVVIPNPPTDGEWDAGLYLTIVFNGLSSPYFSCTSDYFMYDQPYPLIYTWHSDCYWWDTEDGVDIYQRYVILKATYSDWHIYYYDTYNIYGYQHPSFPYKAPLMIFN